MEPEVVSYGAPRDRRSGRRVLTVRNTLFALGAIVVLFLIASFISEMRKPKDGAYGRLYAKRTRDVEVAPRAPMVVIPEGEIADRTGADPLLLEGAQRQAWLGDTSVAPPASSTGVGESLSNESTIQASRELRRKGKIVITGGPGGVELKVKQ